MFWSINWWKFIDVSYHPEKCERIVVYHTPVFFTHNYSLFHMKHDLISKLIKEANKHFQMPSMFSKTSFDCKFSLKNNSIIVSLNMCIERTHLNVVLADRSPQINYNCPARIELSRTHQTKDLCKNTVKILVNVQFLLSAIWNVRSDVIANWSKFGLKKSKN